MTIPADLQANYDKHQQLCDQLDAIRESGPATISQLQAFIADFDKLSAERKPILARERQRRRRARLKAEAGPKPQRKCLCCGARFTPKRSDARMCSRKCTERVSWHRKQVQKLGLEAMQSRENGASYPLWFPDLCGLTPEQHQRIVEAYEQI